MALRRACGRCLAAAQGRHRQPGAGSAAQAAWHGQLLQLEPCRLRPVAPRATHIARELLLLLLLLLVLLLPEVANPSADGRALQITRWR